MMKKHTTKVCFILMLIAVLVLFTGCNKELSPNGNIEGYSYEETEEVTNYVKIVTNKGAVE